MQTKKILGIALAASLVASMAATAAMSVNAAAISDVSEIKDHSVGIIGSFNNWSDDVAMNDDDGDGIYEGVVEIDSVTSDMISEATMDDGSGNQIPRGITGITFKVRLDKDWTDSWGDYEEAYVRTWNSQTNCVVEAKEGTHVKITVKLDTTKNCDEAVAAGEVEKDDDVDYTLIPVTYSIETVDGEGGDTEESSDAEETNDEASEETSDTESSEEESTSEESGEEISEGSIEAPVVDSNYTTQIKDYVFFDNSQTKWDQVYAYWWHPDYARTFDLENNDHGVVKIIGEDGTEGYEPTKFPGTRMEQVMDENGNPTDIWQIRVPFNAQNIIFSCGVSDDEIHAGKIGYQTADLKFDPAVNAGQIYTIDTSVEPKAGRGVDKTKYKYSEGSWSDYEGPYNSEVLNASAIVPEDEKKGDGATGGNDANGDDNNGGTTTVETQDEASNGGSGSTNGSSTGSSSSGSVDAPFTGDAAVAAAFIAVLAAAAGAAFIAFRKKSV